MTKLVVPVDENERAALLHYTKRRRAERLQTMRKSGEAVIPVIMLVLMYLTRARYAPVVGAYGVIPVTILVLATLTLMGRALIGHAEGLSAEDINQYVSTRTPPESWNGDRFADTGRFLEMLTDASCAGVSTIERPRLQHLASCYIRDLRFITGSETPWRRIEAMGDIEIGAHLDDQSDKLIKTTADLRKSFAKGIDWRNDKKSIFDDMYRSYPHVINMAHTFGIDMAGAVRPAPVALPGQVGGLAVEAPIPSQLLTLARQYRETDLRMLNAHDRIEGDAVVDRDIPLLTEAWRKARITSDPELHAAIDDEYAASARTMCITLSDIMVRVAHEARETLRDTGRYISAKHEVSDPLSLPRQDAA